MNEIQLKQKIKKLWQDTFHDSEEYLALIFDNYFNPEFVEFTEHEGEVTSCLLGIPFNFGNAENHIRGLYLHGLATKHQFRSQGLMTGLLNRINEKALEQGFAFTFLIPTDEGLRKYYHDREYVNAFYRVVDNYTSLHDFDLEYDSVLAEQKDKVADLKKRYYESLKTDFLSKNHVVEDSMIDGIVELVRGIEDTQLDLQLIHSDEDLRILIKENTISDGEIHFVYNAAGQISAVAFLSKGEDAVRIHKLYSTDVTSKYKVLSAVKKAHPEHAIQLYVSSIEMDRNALWSRTYGSFMPEAPQVDAISITERVYSLAAHAKVYGMAKILDLVEILKFQANLRHDLKYSILMKSSDAYTLEQIDARNGRVTVRKLTADSVEPSKVAYLMTKRDISEILFRRRDTDNMITEAFGIPSINGSICLLLD